MVKSVADGIASCSRMVRAFVADDSAQDLVEYGFLAAFIGVAGYAILIALPDVMEVTYKSWVPADGSSGVPGAWDPPEPATPAGS